MDPKGKQAKLKSPAELQELLDVTRYRGCHLYHFVTLNCPSAISYICIHKFNVDEDAEALDV